MKFFHNFSSHQKNTNTIGELNNVEGERIHSLEDIAINGVQHFK